MTATIMALKDSFVGAFRLLQREPMLFLPKLAIAIVYGVLLIETTQLLVELVPFTAFEVLSVEAVWALFYRAVALFALSVGALVLDIWVSAWYPALVAQFRAGEHLSFGKAIALAKSRFWTIAPLFLVLEVAASGLLALLASWAWSVSDPAWSAVVFVLILAFFFVFSVFLYPLFSVGVLEKKGVLGSLARSLGLSRSNWKSFSIAALLPFGISLANLVVALFASTLAFWVLFWLIRLLLVLVVTYNAVVSPSVYFSVVDRG